MNKPQRGASAQEKPTPYSTVALRDADSRGLGEISRALGLELNLEEMQAIQHYFKQKKRDPTDLELQTLGQTWSEHCFHKSFKGEIYDEKGNLVASNILRSYIAKATAELNPEWCISVFEDNAGIVDFVNGHAVAAKVETHNHPSAVEPKGGAATGIGGVIRDILGVWARPIANTDVLGFGPLDYDAETIPSGMHSPPYLFRGVIDGIQMYGNNMGIPTINGAILFDESYTGNIVVFCGCIGILPKNKYTRATKPSDYALLIGGRTGRDGIHGVTFASAELGKGATETSRPAVQIAHPFEEEKMMRAILEIRDAGLATGITDLGGGGISCATSEMARRSKCGCIVDLDKVPLKYRPMLPWEIWISESQERMLLSIPGRNLGKALAILGVEEVECSVIGRFTEGNTLQVFYADNMVGDLNLDFLYNPPSARRTVTYEKIQTRDPTFPEPEDYDQTLLRLLGRPNVASKEQVIHQYDTEVLGSTTSKPLTGPGEGPNDAAILKPLDDTSAGIVISCGVNTSYAKISPYWMAASVIDEALRNNRAVGGRRIALLDNFTWGNPEKPDRMASLLEACKACHDFAIQLKAPFISGKDSLYNESPLGPVSPTLLITAIGIIPNTEKKVSMPLKSEGSPIYLLGVTHPELGGSEYLRLRGVLGGRVPQVHGKTAHTIMETLTQAIDKELVSAVHDLSEGGLAVAAAEMCIAGGLGLVLHLNQLAENRLRDDISLFSESNSRFLVEVPKARTGRFEEMMSSVPCTRIGQTTSNNRLAIYSHGRKRIAGTLVDDLSAAWKGGLPAS